MATQFYKRYVPPTNNGPSARSVERPAKKRKLDKLDHDTHDNNIETIQTKTSSSATHALPRGKFQTTNEGSLRFGFVESERGTDKESAKKKSRNDEVQITHAQPENAVNGARKPLRSQKVAFHDVVDENSATKQPRKKRKDKKPKSGEGIEKSTDKQKLPSPRHLQLGAENGSKHGEAGHGSDEGDQQTAESAFTRDNAFKVSSNERNNQSSDEDGKRRPNVKKKGSKENSSKRLNDASKDESKASADYEDKSLGKHSSILAKYASATQASTSEVVDSAANEDSHLGSTQVEAPPIVHGLEPLPQPEPVKEAQKASMTSALPGWIREPKVVSSTDRIPFTHLGLPGSTVERLKKAGYIEAFSIQSTIIPMLISGCRRRINDVCISAATGSGKTIAYALPMVEALKNRPNHRLRGLVVVPTRELVAQAKEMIKRCAGDHDLNIVTAVGSKSLQEEQKKIIARSQRYDPKAYKMEQDKEVDETTQLMDWDFDSMLLEDDQDECLHNHVFEYHTKADILICTPGRLVEHIKHTKGFTLQDVKWLVIDEADRLLDESFQEWVDIVMPELERMPEQTQIEREMDFHSPLLREREICKVIMSATMTKDLSKLESLKLRRPQLVVLESQKEAQTKDLRGRDEIDIYELPEKLQETAVPIQDASDKPLYLARVLESATREPSNVVKPRKKTSGNSDDETPSAGSEGTSSDDSASVPPEAPTHGTLIFTSDNESALRLAALISHISPHLASKIGTLTKSSSSSSGKKTLKAFHKRKISILIASDRASRGLDVQDLSQVINYDMPKSLTSYIHRVGRTARAGKEGKATTLVENQQARWFWNDIARSEKLVRGGGRKVQRWNLELQVSDEERKAYEGAVAKLGEEARGGGKVNKKEKAKA